MGLPVRQRDPRPLQVWAGRSPPRRVRTTVSSVTKLKHLNPSSVHGGTGLRKSAKIYDFLRQHGLQWSAMVRPSDPPAIIEFGHFSILPHRRQLLVEGRPIRLGGRAFDLLLALIDAPGAVVGKNELVSRIWPGRIVEENRLQSEISALRKALGTDRELIRTVSGRGYQFTGEIHEVGSGVGAQQVPAPSAVPARPGRAT